MNKFYYKGYKVSKLDPSKRALRNALCGCPLEKFPIKHYVSIEKENGERGYILISDEEFKRIKEKLEIREVFS